MARSSKKKVIPVDNSTLAQARALVLADLKATLEWGRRVVAHNHFITDDGFGLDESWPQVLYAAIGHADGTVSARVILWKQQSGEIDSRALHEDQGPDQYVGVARKVLAALTPTDNEAARQWRTRAQHWTGNGTNPNLRMTSAVGQVIALPQPLDFPGVGQVAIVKVVKGSLFRAATPQHDGTVITGQRLLGAPPGWERGDFSVLTPGRIAALAAEPDAPQEVRLPVPLSPRPHRSPTTLTAADLNGVPVGVTAQLTNDQIELALHAAGNMWKANGGDRDDMFTLEQHEALNLIVATQHALRYPDSYRHSAAIAAATLTNTVGQPHQGTHIQPPEPGTDNAAGVGDSAGLA